MYRYTYLYTYMYICIYMRGKLISSFIQILTDPRRRNYLHGNICFELCMRRITASGDRTRVDD